MKKIYIVLLFCVALCAAPLVANDNYLLFGMNYSLTLSDGEVAHGIGGNISYLGDFGGNNKVFVALGFTGDVSGERAIDQDDLKDLGVDSIDMNCYTIPLHAGYPFMVNFTDSMTLLIIPQFAFDFMFFDASFSQNIPQLDYKADFDVSGIGYSIGLALNVGMQHTFGKFVLRYGADLDMPLLTMLTMDIEAENDYIDISTSTSSVTTIADAFVLSTSPYVSMGIKF